MKDKTFFYKQITSLLESSELDFSVVTDLVEIRKQKLAEVEDIVNRIREGRHSGKLIRTARDDAAQTFLFRAYDPVSGRLVVQKKTHGSILLILCLSSLADIHSSKTNKAARNIERPDIQTLWSALLTICHENG